MLVAGPLYRIAFDCTGVCNLMSTSSPTVCLFDDEFGEIIFKQCVFLILFTWGNLRVVGEKESCYGSDFVREKLRRGENKKQDSERGREIGKHWGRSIVECFFSTVMMKYGVSRSGA